MKILKTKFKKSKNLRPSRATDKHSATLSLCVRLDSATVKLQSPSQAKKGHSATLSLCVKGKDATVKLQGRARVENCHSATLSLCIRDQGAKVEFFKKKLKKLTQKPNNGAN